METTNVDIGALFGREIQFIIPLFQRHYVWTEVEQWEPLWSDIEGKVCQRLSEEHQEQQFSHFTGAIVIQPKMAHVNEIRKYEIIDGQQRLTTFQIVLCALRNICKLYEYDDIYGQIERYLRNQSVLLDNSDNEQQYKLIPTEFDRVSFISLIDEDEDKSNGSIFSAYIYFKKKIVNYVGSDRRKILALFRSVQNDFGFVQILLDLHDEPEKIFESLNARGKPLLQFDLLRNNLFLRAHQDRDHLYREYWDHFETPYWDPEENSGTSSEVFLQHFLMAKLGAERVKPEFNTYQRRYRPKIESTDTIRDEFSELQRYSHIYQEMTECKDDSEIGQRMQFYKTFGLTTLHPFILFVKCEVGLSGDELKYVFDILESYTLRRMLCYRGKNGLKNYNRFFSQLIEDFSDDFSLENFVKHLSNQTSNARRYPADDEIEPTLHTRYDDDSMIFADDSAVIFPDNRAVKAALYGLWIETAGQIQRRLIRYILYRIELMKKSEDKFAEILVFKDDLTTLEHIMPNEWKKTWHLPIADGAITYDTNTRSVYVNRDADNTECLYENLFADPEEPTRNGLIKESYSDTFNLALARDDLLQSIGNLTLVTRELNSKLGNRTFPKKKEALNKHSGLKLNNEVCQHNAWDVNEIHARAEKLITDVCQIWPSLEWFAENIP